MAIKKYKATTNARRNMSGLTFDEITTSTPEKSCPFSRTAFSIYSDAFSITSRLLI